MLTDDINDRLDRLAYNRIGLGREPAAAELGRLSRIATLGRELADLCEQRAEQLRAGPEPARNGT